MGSRSSLSFFLFISHFLKTSMFVLFLLLSLILPWCFGGSAPVCRVSDYVEVHISVRERVFNMCTQNASLEEFQQAIPSIEAAIVPVDAEEGKE